jgi:hypothetical protein
MSNSTLFRRLFQLCSLVVVVLLVASNHVMWASAAEDQTAGMQIVNIDVAEDGTRFAFSKEFTFPDGMPKHGSPFVTQGYIYPEGTLSGSNGALANGAPEFPDMVIGEWYCYGSLIGEGAHSTTGPWVVSTQIFKFNEQYGGATIITNGLELSDLNVEGARAIIGGTGTFSMARGEQMQTLLGFTEVMGVNLRVQLRIADVEAIED